MSGNKVDNAEEQKQEEIQDGIFMIDENDDEDGNDEGPITLRKKIFRTVDNPQYSKLALCIAVVVILTIVVSTVTFLVGTLPQYYISTPNWINVTEYVCIAIFTMEYVVRLVCVDKWWVWCRGLFPLIDLLAILPFYIELAAQSASSGGLAVVRVLRLVRIFRVFKVSKYSQNLKVIVATLKRSKDGLALLTFLVLLVMILFSSFMYFAEQSGSHYDDGTQQWIRKDGSVSSSPYQSIPDSFWWCIVTMTTVGYGDQYPVTTAGRFVGACTMFMGIMVLAFPISVFATNFTEEWRIFIHDKIAAQGRKKADANLLKLSQQEVVRKVELLYVEMKDLVGIIAENTDKMKEKQSEMEQLINILRINNPTQAEVEN